MTDTSTVRDRLQQASSVAAILDAAHEAFEEMLSVIRGYQDGGAPFWAALVMASAAAADGRDAVAAAPSSPIPSCRGRRASTPSGHIKAEDAAPTVAALSEAVAERLLRAAGLAETATDRQACLEGARYASEIHGLMTGTWP